MLLVCVLFRCGSGAGVSMVCVCVCVCVCVWGVVCKCVHVSVLYVDFACVLCVCAHHHGYTILIGFCHNVIRPPSLPHHSSLTTPPSPLLPHHSSLTTPPSPLLPYHSSLTTPPSPLLPHHSSLTTLPSFNSAIGFTYSLGRKRSS